LLTLQPPLPFDLSPIGREDLAPALDAPPAAVSYPPPECIRHARARRYIVRVRADGSVRVTIPRRGSKREAIAFADAQRAWIEKQRARLVAERAARAGRTGARDGPDASAPLDEDASTHLRELRNRAERELPVRLLELAAGLGLTVARVSIRNQQWRWGSCSRQGHICLNWRLVTMPGWVRDYVLIHELMHLKRLDHSPKFWTLVAAACPAYQDARAWLRTYQRA
jgi:predicted metal-dependent hydrolase